MLSFPRSNNLEWLRLVFAIQVVVVHLAEHLNFQIPSLVRYVPGVPAFFFVSGFLIYASYRNAPGSRYFENRFLRLFPALLLVTVGGLGVAVAAHGWGDLVSHLKVYALWFLAQITIGQAYNPSIFRDIGTGVINGSLWTITTEIIFYLMVPILVLLEGRFRHAVTAFTVLSFAVYVGGPHLWTAPIYREKTLFDVLALTPIVWGWMFGLGILAVKNYEHLQRHLRHFPLLLFVLIAMIFFGEGPLFGAGGNRLGFFYFLCYSGLILWIGFGLPHLRLSFDLSYGIYIWHMPVINFALTLGVMNGGLVLASTILVAAFSWFVVEKPALNLKRQSLRAMS